MRRGQVRSCGANEIDMATGEHMTGTWDVCLYEFVRREHKTGGGVVGADTQALASLYMYMRICVYICFKWHNTGRGRVWV